jgi:23S rRNA pseudouridine1911/1915/1917 synthase
LALETQNPHLSTQLSEDQYLVTHEVGPNQGGIRLDRFLKERYRHRSRETLKKAIDSGAITLERSQGRHLVVGRLKPSSQLVVGDRVLVLSERRPEPEVDFNYRVLFEDEWLFVIEKPANLPVHPAGRYFFNTLLVHLKTQGHRTPLRSEREFFLVHRIDKETSGILVLAKQRDACADLVRQFAERRTEKRYLAVARGIAPEEFVVDAPMRRALGSAIALKMEVAPESEGGQSALTRFRRLRVVGDFSVVECHPKTGRQHQIRVHLEHAGHPIVGDKLYGLPEREALRFFERSLLTPECWARLLHPRHALHAAGIRFVHPMTREPLEFSSELPQDLENFLSGVTK